MTTNPPLQLLTPEWVWDLNPQLSSNYDSVRRDTLNLSDPPSQPQTSPFDFSGHLHDSNNFSHGVPEPRFGDPILYPWEDDAQPDTDEWLVKAFPELSSYGPREAAVLEAADLSGLIPDIPDHSPPYQHSYPTPSSLASPPASQGSPGPNIVDSTASLQHICGDCGEGFSKARQLQLHRNKHVRPFTCISCGKGHARKKDMHRHMWKHHEAEARRLKIPPVDAKCPIPGCKFTGRDDNVQRHIKTKHRRG